MLELRAITKSFGGTVALDRVDFSARAGEIHALLGENGAGKSTLMHLLSGLYRLEAGEIRLDGRPIAIASPRDAASAGIQMVYQHFTLVDRFTVAENLALAGPMREPATDEDHRMTGHEQAGGSPATEVAAGKARSLPSQAQNSVREGGLRVFTARDFSRRVHFCLWDFARAYDPRQAAAPALEMAERLGWRLDADARVGDLPVGVQQRVEIVKALQREARVLIFDEPTAVLAPSEVEELFAVLRRLRDEGRLLIFISHKLSEVMSLCDRVTVLRRGRHVATVAVAETNPRQLAGWMVGSEGALRREGEGARERGSEGTGGRGSEGARERGSEGVGLVLDGVVVAAEGRARAVDRVSLVVQRGEILGLAGVDGNGQVELAEAIWGIRPVAAGSITVRGEVVAPSPPRPLPRPLALSLPRPLAPSPHLGWIPQDRHRTGLVLGLSVRENLVLTLVGRPEYRWGPFLRWGKLRALADRLIERFDIRVASPEQMAGLLSGGNQQKIVVARALLEDPEVLVAVNPTRGLDIGASEYVHAQLRRARDRGAAVLLISTELDEVVALGDRVGVLYEGRLMGIVPPDTPREELGLMMGGRARAEISA